VPSPVGSFDPSGKIKFYSRDIYIKGVILNIWEENLHIGVAFGLSTAPPATVWDFPGICYNTVPNVLRGGGSIFSKRHIKPNPTLCPPD
jgi:hypothetical protein